jgi:hypothetical protein
MFLYVAASNRVVSAVMVVERKEEGKEQLVQRPVYHISEALTESNQHYPHYQKLVYSVFRAQQRLAPYFHEHAIKVVASMPLAISSSMGTRLEELPSGSRTRRPQHHV